MPPSSSLLQSFRLRHPTPWRLRKRPAAVAHDGSSTPEPRSRDGGTPPGSPRHLSTEAVQALTVPPAYFTGLLGALWVWKCMMMVIFQNKIIYMPGMPPAARRETIADYAGLCGGIRWHTQRLRSTDGTDLALAIASVTPSAGVVAHGGDDEATEEAGPPPKSHVYILYFQGNASSIPPRLPSLSGVLKTVINESKRMHKARNVRYTMVCLSYRGYWTSRGRPSERGLNRDAAAGLRWVSELHEGMYGPNARHPRTVKPIVLLWGQSVGSGIATNLAAAQTLEGNLAINGLILETPFLSMRAMLQAFYPQKWLPYKHLWPFLRNRLDSSANLTTIAETSGREGRAAPSIFLLIAGRDEVVPEEQSLELYQRCESLGYPVERKIVRSALHNEVLARDGSTKAVAEFILRQGTAVRI